MGVAVDKLIRSETMTFVRSSSLIGIILYHCTTDN